VKLGAAFTLAVLLLGGVPSGAQRSSFSFVPARQAASPPAPSPTGDITVTLITFGLGEEVWERFGHNALWIHDARTGADVAYNWGLFDFAQPGFLQRFLTGDTKYWMAGENANGMLAAYHGIGRPITLQRLNLTAAQANALRDFVEWNARDENKYYRYDYFRDNCSTRLRDALDRALGGALRRATDSVPTSLTYRSESVRLTDGDAPVQAGIDIALGRPADVPLTAWQSFFIPMRLRDAVRTIRVPGEDGALVPLVAQERAIDPPPTVPRVVEAPRPPSLIPRYFSTGLLLAATVVGLRIMMVSRRSAAWGLSLFGAAWSLLCGVLGVVLLLAWFATRHVFWRGNENVLLLSPLSLILVVLIPMSLLRGRAGDATRGLGTFVALLGLLALLLAILPGGQSSGPIVALILPVHLALAWALGLPRRTRARVA
jgi:hypothetical protein